ncbi:SPOR domain-containing protein [Arenibacter latericius]|uniref:SPOR domain-containing protein n=1 Tax=Arenibacter latericius TaxID=86104 RepID=UPI000423FA4D|nr:SPOR domain-containing protein [Arenibacter latericius]MDX1364099.1 SPOR domain-containing protein [Arenibacter latericius]
MKNTCLFIVIAFSAIICSAQQGNVNIQQDNKITQLLNIYKDINENTNYYRIQVGFGSHQEAQNLKAKVDLDFPDWPTKIDFESPSYRVRIGNFRTLLEGERKLIEVRQKYPSAMLLKPEKTTN